MVEIDGKVAIATVFILSFVYKAVKISDILTIVPTTSCWYFPSGIILAKMLEM